MKAAIFVNLALRVLAWKHPEHRKEFRAARRDQLALEAITIEMKGRYENQYGAIGDGTFMEFFQWLLDNWEEILKIIMIFMEGDE